jgi:hypothetical protein
MSAKVCFITAIYGGYETTCKKFATQTITTDFICFTDNPNITTNGWIVDATPYHLTHPSPLDNSEMINSLSNNKNPFNIAKYYKQAFQNIPRLKEYDAVIWIDGTIQIISPIVSYYLLENIQQHKIIGWEHEWRGGSLLAEVHASNCPRYTSTTCNGFPQPFQYIYSQYNAYIADGYDESWFKRRDPNRKNIGIWLTCFVAFSNKDIQVAKFLDKWYKQTLTYTTQDQIGFPYVCQKMNLLPYTLPDKDIKGDSPHATTDFYRRVDHGQ